MSVTLLIDVSYLSWRAFHTTGSLSYLGEPTGVLFGVLRDIEGLIDQFGARRVVLAFDAGGRGFRGQLLPTYKAHRDQQQRTDEEEQALEHFYIQLVRMRAKIFPTLGFRNVFQAKGYEADDILAYCANRLNGDEQGIIVTADKDLWQCLRSNVSCYNPTQKVLMTSELFKERWEIDPCQWADVKAFAGCSSDNVPGIDGVGEKTAAKWFRGKLKPDSKAYQAISSNLDVHTRNIPLVRLPYPGLELPELRDDELSESRKVKVQAELGIRSDRRPRQQKAAPVSKGFDL